MLETEGDRRGKVVELAIEAIEPRRLVVRHEVRSGRFGQRQIVIPMGYPDGVERVVAELFELAGGKVSDGFEESVPRLAATGFVELHQTLVHQRGERFHEFTRLRAPGADDVFDGREVESAGEHRQAGQHVALIGAQQVPGPGHHGQQCLLSGQRGSGATGEEGEALIEPALQLGERHESQAGGSQFEGEGDSVETTADMPHGMGSRGIPSERGPALGGALDEELHRLTVANCISVVVIIRRGEGGDPEDVFSWDAQRLPAGRQHRQAGTCLEELLGQPRYGMDQVLAIVQKQEE